MMPKRANGEGPANDSAMSYYGEGALMIPPTPKSHNKGNAKGQTSSSNLPTVIPGGNPREVNRVLKNIISPLKHFSNRIMKMLRLCYWLDKHSSTITIILKYSIT